MARSLFFFFEREKNSAHWDRTQKRDETPSSRNETPSSPHRRTTRLLLIAATTRLRPPGVRSANESSVAQAGRLPQTLQRVVCSASR
eukprot:scaffold51308_cov42-Phaeocystis_antarctica.AAC.1